MSDSGVRLMGRGKIFKIKLLMMAFYHIRRSCKKVRLTSGEIWDANILHILECMTIGVFQSVSHLGQENVSSCKGPLESQSA